MLGTPDNLSRRSWMRDDPTAVEDWAATGASATATAGPPSSMIERVTLIMDLFDGPTRRLTLEVVATKTGLPRSSAHRILEQLSNLEWVERSSSGYRLGPRARGFGRLAGGDSALRSAAAPLLHELSMTTGMVAHLAVLDGADVVYLDKVGGRLMADVPSRVGGRAPAHRTALGKGMLAWLTPEQVDARLAGRIDVATRATDMRMLHLELARIRTRNGLTFERGEWFPQNGCVAVGMRGLDGPVGAISLVGDARAPLERVAPLVVRAARQATRDLLGLVRESGASSHPFESIHSEN
jgi:DNA-binding IclR family transcriptional regulator